MKLSEIKLLTLICLLLMTNCVQEDIYESKVREHVFHIINVFKKGIDAFSDKFNYEFNPLKEEPPYKVGNLIESEETAIKIAEALFDSELSLIKQHIKFYAYKYKNIWFVYGCYDLDKYVKANWGYIDNWGEMYVIISAQTSEVYIIHRIMKLK